MRADLGRLFVAGTLMLGLTGCYTHRYTLGKGASTEGSPRYEKWHSHWLAGLISTDPEINLSQLCPSGNLTIVDKRSFLNMVVGYFIGIIWSPSVVSVYCDDQVTSMTLTPAQLERIGRSEAFADWVKGVAPERLDEVLAARARVESTNVCLAQVDDSRSQR